MNPSVHAPDSQTQSRPAYHRGEWGIDSPSVITSPVATSIRMPPLALFALQPAGSSNAYFCPYDANPSQRDGNVAHPETLISIGEILGQFRDSGIGIAADDLGQIFERYHRGANTAGVVGTGVGLYLVKMVVDLHGGAIAVDSQLGRGSTFTVRLPVLAGADLAG